jgi:hypothetical protein
VPPVFTRASSRISDRPLNMISSKPSPGSEDNRTCSFTNESGVRPCSVHMLHLKGISVINRIIVCFARPLALLGSVKHMSASHRLKLAGIKFQTINTADLMPDGSSSKSKMKKATRRVSKENRTAQTCPKISLTSSQNRHSQPSREFSSKRANAYGPDSRSSLF